MESAQNVKYRTVKTMYDKTCPICGTRFVTDIAQQKYCDAECAEIGYKEAQRRYRDKSKRKTATLDDKVRAAAEAGLSYGQYVIRERLKNASGS